MPSTVVKFPSAHLDHRGRDLDLGRATQLYDKTVVYSHKRHGDFALGGRRFAFRIKPSFPKTLSREFLLVDLVNNLDRLAESKEEVLAQVRESVASYDAARRPRLRRAALEYDNVRARNFSRKP
jgi:hypothetical protein